MLVIPFYLGLATLFGASVSLLVSRSLARSIGVTGLGRYLLAIGISFGVISVGVKSVIAYAVTSNMDSLHPSDLSRKSGVGYVASQDYSQGPGYLSWRGYSKPPRAPVNNPQSPAKVALGKKLFEDVRLSSSGQVSCASCHKLEEGGDDNRATSLGVDGLMGARNAPTVINAAYLKRFFWDGRAHSLEDQAKGPFVNPVEMAMPSLSAVAETVASDPDYPPMFRQAFGEGAVVDEDTIVKAIASFERTLYSTQAPYDRFVAGDIDALTPLQKYGMLRFDEVGCRSCHTDPTFSSLETGIYRKFPVRPINEYVKKYSFLDDKGRAEQGDGDPVSGLWRVPSLRNVEHTAPYFHNGAVDTLEEAVRVMASVQLGYDVEVSGHALVDVKWDAETQQLSRAGDQSLSQQDVDALAAFLTSLSSPQPLAPN